MEEEKKEREGTTKEHLYTFGEIQEAMDALGWDGGDPGFTPAQNEVFMQFALSLREASGIKKTMEEGQEVLLNSEFLTGVFSGVAAFFMDMDKMPLFLLPRTRNEILDRLTNEEIAERAQQPEKAQAAKDSGETPTLYEFFLWLGFLFACERLKALPKDLLKKLKKEGAKDYGPFSVAPNSKALIKFNHMLAGGGRDMGKARSFEEIKSEVLPFTSENGEQLEKVTTTYVNNRNNEKIVLSMERPAQNAKDEDSEKDNGKPGPRTARKKAKIQNFFWQQYVDGGHPGEVKLFYDDLEQLGICSSRKYAIEALDSFAEWFEASTQKASYYRAQKKGANREKYMGGDKLIIGTRRTLGGWIFKINPDAAIYEIYARDYTVFPNFGYRLSDNAFFILRYIFYLGGTNASQLRGSENKAAANSITFSLPFDALRTAAGLLPPEDVKKKGRNYAGRIKKPIIDALEEIRKEAKRENIDDAILLEYDEEQEPNIDLWLEKRLKVTLAGKVAQAFRDSIVRRRKKIKKADGGEDPKKKETNAQEAQEVQEDR